MPTTTPETDAAETAAEVETETPAPESPPTNVIQALAAVMRELPGIGKDNESEQGYRYRGIEAITAHAQQLLGRYGVVFVPHVESVAVKDFTINSRPWTEHQANITYTVYGPGGVDDNIVVGPLLALGRDNSDKGMNKCMTQAFKYALLQTLCIGDHKDDADKDEAAVADERREAVAVDPDKEARAELGRRLRAMTPEQRELIRNYCDEHKIPRVPAQFSDDQMAEVEAFVDRMELESTEDQPASPEAAADEPGGDPDPEASAEPQEAAEPLPLPAHSGLIQGYLEQSSDEQVRAELERRGLPVTGKAPTWRKVLRGTLEAELGA